MCGFAGIVHWDKEPVDAGEMDRMRSLLRHRGPDEQVSASPETGVGLSHCRLKVIDLSETGRQPMAGEAGAAWICYNGEIYNFQELRAELESGGARFRGRSDTEVILRAYERWGRDAFPRLQGMFAIAIWDGRNRTILLVRDRAGKKPLYWWTDGRCLAFASEAKALSAHPHVPWEVDESLFAYQLSRGYPPPGKSSFREIRQIPPASILEFRAGVAQPEPQRYWELPAEQPERQAPGRLQDELRELLTAAVRRRMVSDVPLGAFLSGGMDSTVIVGLMRQLQPDGELRTFSIGFQGDLRFNETPFARIAARRFRTTHTEFEVEPQPFELVDRLVWHFDQPFGDSSTLPAYILCQLARSKVTVALSGDGGDELFAGYDRFAAVLLAKRVPAWTAKAGAQLLVGSRLPLHPRSVPGRLHKFCAMAQQPAGHRLGFATGYFSDPAKLLRVTTRQETPFGAHRKGRDGLNSLLEENFLDYLPNDLLVKMDRCSMAHGLEARSPFLDTALVEWAFRLPAILKLRQGVSKWILREAFRDILPPQILSRRKAGFGVPLGAWFRGRWRQPMQDLLLSSQAKIYRHLRHDAVEEVVHEHLAGRRDLGQEIWLLLTFELWLRQTQERTRIPSQHPYSV